MAPTQFALALATSLTGADSVPIDLLLCEFPFIPTAPDYSSGLFFWGLTCPACLLHGRKLQKHRGDSLFIHGDRKGNADSRSIDQDHQASIDCRGRPNRSRLCRLIASAVPSGSYSFGAANMRSRPIPRRSHAVNGS
jgi:hypothetical protein